jgi:hypothetical protein
VGIGYSMIGAVFWFLMGYAIYRARDFRLSRTLWRGVRFDQRGNAWVYALKRFLWSIAMVLTLGLIYPWMASSLWRYRYNNSWYGDRQWQWTGSWKTIAGPYYLIYFLIVAAFVAAFVAVGASPLVYYEGIYLPNPAGLGWMLGAGVIAFLGWFYFRAREATRMFSQVRIGAAQATVKVRARALFGQFVAYVLALIGSTIALSIAGGALAGIIFASGGSTSGTSGNIFVDIASGGWLTIIGLIVAYLAGIAVFALMSEVFLGFGYWMLVARGATISNADSLGSVRATDEDLSLAGEGLADALNVGAY